MLQADSPDGRALIPPVRMFRTSLKTDFQLILKRAFPQQHGSWLIPAAFCGGLDRHPELEAFLRQLPGGLRYKVEPTFFASVIFTPNSERSSGGA